MRTRSSVWLSSSNTSAAEKPQKTTSDRDFVLTDDREDFGRSFLRGDGDGFLVLPQPDADSHTTEGDHHSKSAAGFANRPISNTAEDEKQRRLFADSAKAKTLHVDRVLRSDGSPHKRLFADNKTETQLHHRVLRSSSKSKHNSNRRYFKSPTKTESDGVFAARSRRRTVVFHDLGVVRQKDVVPEVIGEVQRNPTFDEEFSDEDLSEEDDDSGACGYTTMWDRSTIIILVLFVGLRLLYEVWPADFTLIPRSVYKGFGLFENKT